MTLEQFLASTEKRAYRIALIASGNSADALDIVQEAMLKLVQRYSNKTADEWGPLFHRILQSKITDHYRRQKFKNQLQSWFGNEDEKSDPSNERLHRMSELPEQVTQQRVAIEKLDNALQALPLRQKQAFLLRQWEGLDVAQTAAAMGCSSGSVKTHYSRAVHALRAQLEDHWP